MTETNTEPAAPAEKNFNKDSIGNTLFVAISLCLVCSFLVSAAAVAFKNMQDTNVERDRKKNILQVAGFSEEEIGTGEQIDKLFESRFKAKIIDFSTGKFIDENDEGFQKVMEELNLPTFEDALSRYDQIAAARTKKEVLCDPVPRGADVAQIKHREKYSHIYMLIDENGQVERYVLPVRGYGLWSMLKGFFAIEPDFQTVAGLTFFEQKETPGLGGEVDNPNWKAIWTEDKKLYSKDGEVKLQVIKGLAGDDPYAVDGLSGATITSVGVSNMLKYWMGPNGYGPFIKNQKTNSGSAANQSNHQGGLDG